MMLATCIQPDEVLKEKHFVNVEDLMQKKIDAMRAVSKNSF